MKRLRIVAVVAAALVALTGCDFSIAALPLPGGADLGDHPYTVKIQFRDVLDLVPQSSVKVDEVTVGKVQDIDLSDYTAVVTAKLNGDVKLPANAVAKIRQTSLLGEKFVELAPPDSGAQGTLSDGDTIPLSRTGRNPEVEEVFGALALILNGGGVGQLKTITVELNKALSGREGDVKSVLDQISSFMGQLDTNKQAILTAIERLNALSVGLNRQQGTLDSALDNLPKALASVDRQRDDLVKMLKALANLSDVGTRVVHESKAATIDSLQALAPALTKLADAGDDFPRSLQLFLTFPFVDAVVGKNPQQARDLHMGDYTNLSATLELDLSGSSGSSPPLDPSPIIDQCKKTPLAPICSLLGSSGGLASGLGRSTPESGETSAPSAGNGGVDTELGALLAWGMVS